MLSNICFTKSHIHIHISDGRLCMTPLNVVLNLEYSCFGCVISYWYWDRYRLISLLYKYIFDSPVISLTSTQEVKSPCWKIPKFAKPFLFLPSQIAGPGNIQHNAISKWTTYKIVLLQAYFPKTHRRQMFSFDICCEGKFNS